MESKNEKKTVIVPWDFTEVAKNALLHAIKIARTIDVNITLLHIGKEDDTTTVRMNESIAECLKIKNVSINWIIKDGSIFSTIRETAEGMNAVFVVMGTHGIKGMQKLTGSKALKVIAESSVPFIVVQNPPNDSPFSKIVCPIDFTKENKEKLRWADFISRYFSTKLYLFIPYIVDNTLLKKTKANLTFAKTYLEERNIKFEMKASQEKGKFSEQTVAFAEEIGADLIMIMTTKHIGITDYMFGADEQQIISNNASIPVMTINPRLDTGKLGGFY
ncbi:MAG: universal stress protein UspA [Bacteroidetes bacterium HGW-Bacteroidetes-21]|jgi:nucleotide-binding universal stress UspA family protein|nr:MAG: universal stress protein UspA [Bacteroidetes bacterium HGW-Bacteroidetes-21]